MDFRKTITRLLPAISRAIRHHYPEDYAYRCFQSSIATAILLEEAGFSARVVAGDFEIATRNLVNGTREFHGFKHATHLHSHFWCISENHCIDVATPFLASSSTKPVLKPPLICWNLERPLIPELRFTVRDPNPKICEIMGEEDRAGIAAVVKDARKRMTVKSVGVGTQRPVLFGPATLRENALKRDPWCAWVVSSATPPRNISVLPARPVKAAAQTQRRDMPGYATDLTG